MVSTRASISKASKRPKINIIPPKQLFVDLTQDDTKNPSPKLQLSSPSAPNAPSKTPSTKDTSSSSIDYIPKSLTSSTSLSPYGYLNPPTYPPLRVSPPPPTQENTSMDITLTLSPITLLDVQFNIPSPSPHIVGHPIPWNLLEGHRDSCFQPNGSQLVHEDLEQIHEDDLEKMDLKWQLALLSMRTIRGPRNQDSRNMNQDSSRRIVNMEETSSKAMLAIDGAGFDWSYMADDEVPTNITLWEFSDSKGSQIPDKSRKGVGFVSYNAIPPPPTGLFLPPNLNLSNSGLEEFQKPEFEGYGPKTSKNVCNDTSNKVRESLDAPMVEKLVLDDKLEKKTIFPTVTMIEFVRAKQQEKPVRKLVNFDHVHANCNYHQRERVVSGSNYTRVNYNYSAKKTHPSAQRNMVPKAVLMKTGLRSVNTARPVNTTHPKPTVYSARPMSHFSKSAQSTVKRPYQIKTTLTNKNSSQKVNTAKGKFYTARPKAINTARPNSVVVNVVRANQVNAVKASACWVWRPTKLNIASITLKKHNYVDARGRSKNLMEDMLPLGEDNMKLKELMDLCTKLPEKFKNIATVRTLDNEEMEITATIDGKVKIVSEASIRRHLELEDYDGISNLPTTEIFEQLALMGAQLFEESVVPQPRSPTQTNVADEAASTGVDVRLRGATTTVTGLEAG
ncbi:hypothetical protein Tco_1284330 [Tanacetum coccineum]